MVSGKTTQPMGPRFKTMAAFERERILRRAASVSRTLAVGPTGMSITTEVVDVVAEPLPGGPYDLVLLAYLQLPEPQRREALAHCVAALARGGTLLEVAHDASNLPDGYGGPQDAAVLATPDDVVTGLLAADSALRIERAEVVERRVATPDGERIALDHVIRAVRP